MNRDRGAVRPFLLLVALTACCSLATASPSFATPALDYTLVHATLVQPGNASDTAAEAISTASTRWSSVVFATRAGLKLRQLTNLSTDYKFVDGSSCWGGSPRFAVRVTNGTSSGNIFFYIGPYPNYTGCVSGQYANSGNLAAPTSIVDASQVGGAWYEPYPSALTKYGNYTVTSVRLDVDGFWVSSQKVDFDNTEVNQALATYEG